MCWSVWNGVGDCDIYMGKVVAIIVVKLWFSSNWSNDDQQQPNASDIYIYIYDSSMPVC